MFNYVKTTGITRNSNKCIERNNQKCDQGTESKADTNNGSWAVGTLTT